MDEALVSELEAAIADVGALLVRARKYRSGAGSEGDALAREALALGDRARRLHRRGVLDDREARALLEVARALAGRVQGLVRAVHESAEYARAVAAHRAGDQAALAATLPAIFADVEPAAAPGDLFHPLAWRRRGRPRPADDVAAEVRRASEAGLEAGGDDLSPGADAALPALVLLLTPPADEAVSLRFPAGALGVPVFRLGDTGEHLVYVARLRAPFRVVLRTALEGDDAEGLAAYDTYRAAIAAALRAAGIAVDVI